MDMKTLIFLALYIAVVAKVAAHTGGKVEVVCPLDDTKFETWQDFSGTSFGSRLDFKKIGPIAQPWALAQCPKCHYPLIKSKKELSEKEIAQLKTIVSSKEFRKSTKQATSYYALGVLKEQLNEKPMDIAWAYLCASWQVEDEPAKYKTYVLKAVYWYDAAARTLSPATDAEEKENYFAACWLGVELTRRIADFSDGEKRLSRFPKIDTGAPEWLAEGLKFQAKLISNKDSSPHDFSDISSTEKPPKAKKRTKPDSKASVEDRVRWNLRQLYVAAQMYFLSAPLEKSVTYNKLLASDYGKEIEKPVAVAGEDYSQLEISSEADEISITLPDGKIISDRP